MRGGGARTTRNVVLVTMGAILLVLAIFLVITWVEGDSSQDRNGPTKGLGRPVPAHVALPS